MHVWKKEPGNDSHGRYQLQMRRQRMYDDVPLYNVDVPVANVE